MSPSSPRFNLGSFHYEHGSFIIFEQCCKKSINGHLRTSSKCFGRIHHSLAQRYSGAPGFVCIAIYRPLLCASDHSAAGKYANWARIGVPGRSQLELRPPSFFAKKIDERKRNQMSTTREFHMFNCAKLGRTGRFACSPQLKSKRGVTTRQLKRQACLTHSSSSKNPS